MGGGRRKNVEYDLETTVEWEEQVIPRKLRLLMKWKEGNVPQRKRHSSVDRDKKGECVPISRVDKAPAVFVSKAQVSSARSPHWHERHDRHASFGRRGTGDALKTKSEGEKDVLGDDLSGASMTKNKSRQEKRKRFQVMKRNRNRGAEWTYSQSHEIIEAELRSVEQHEDRSASYAQKRENSHATPAFGEQAMNPPKLPRLPDRLLCKVSQRARSDV